VRGLQPVGIDQLQQYNVNVEGVPDVIWQPLWDYQTYSSAGFTGPTLFFQVPNGSSGKTIEDTNMGAPGGSLPAPVNMLITGIECVFFAGSVPAVVTGDETPSPANFQLNDLYAVHKGRMSFKLTIGDQTWLNEAPLGVFPSQFYLDGFAAAHFTQATAADDTVVIDYASFRGPMYQVVPYRLISNQDFTVAVNSPAAISLPSGNDARWGFRLHGYRFRLAT
jgi:hypothetical protein